MTAGLIGLNFHLLRIFEVDQSEVQARNSLNFPKSYLTQKILLMWLLISLTSR